MKVLLIDCVRYPYLEFTWSPKAPVCENDVLEFFTNAVEFHNKSNIPVILDGGRTLDAGESYTIGASNEINFFKKRMTIVFDESVTPVDSGGNPVAIIKKLEVVENHLINYSIIEE